MPPLFEDDDTSQWDADSTYSRSTGPLTQVDQPFSVSKESQPHRNSSDLPEVNEIDHAISSFRGHTVAVDAMRSRLQATKLTRGKGEVQERLMELQHELHWHQRENEFYRTCYNLYQELHSKVSEITQILLLKSLFEPETRPSYDPCLYDIIRRLDLAVKLSQLNESKAEADFKAYWKIPSTLASTRWL